jgi:hypothetical protein
MNPIAELETFENETARFDSLMSFKIQNILLVSSLSDIYNLHEDGQLTDLLVAEYAEFRSAQGIKIRADHRSSYAHRHQACGIQQESQKAVPRYSGRADGVSPPGTGSGQGRGNEGF